MLFGEAGRDATEAFEDVGHSDEAREILTKYHVGSCTEVRRVYINQQHIRLTLIGNTATR